MSALVKLEQTMKPTHGIKKQKGAVVINFDCDRYVIAVDDMSTVRTEPKKASEALQIAMIHSRATGFPIKCSNCDLPGVERL